MGLLINGVWEKEEVRGKLVPTESIFRHWVTADGTSGFKAEPNRYHLYISLACPWACRTLIFRKIKRLEDIISLSVVDPILSEEGWIFSTGEGCIPDTANGFKYLHQLYTVSEPKYTGRVTVPVLWDKQTKRIVNNESSEIIRMFNSEFNAFGDASLDFYPKPLWGEIDLINRKIYEHINIGVYRCGFAATQEAYEQAFNTLFAELNALDKRLSAQRYLVKSQITEADWRLFTTLVRFDPVYYSHFKCNWRRIKDYSALHHYLCELYQYPRIAETVNFDHIKRHYYLKQKTTGIIPKGPEMDLRQQHGREKISL